MLRSVPVAMLCSMVEINRKQILKWMYAAVSNKRKISQQKLLLGGTNMQGRRVSCVERCRDVRQEESEDIEKRSHSRVAKATYLKLLPFLQLIFTR